MPLRETLDRLRQQEKQPVLDRPARIAEWQRAVDARLAEIRDYLSEYEQDGSLSIKSRSLRITEVDGVEHKQRPQLSIKSRSLRITEEGLGTYQIGAMDIEAGPAPGSSPGATTAASFPPPSGRTTSPPI